MNLSIFACLLVANSLLIATSTFAASPLAQKLIVRRQSSETEKEATNANSGNNAPPARLYPDLPQQPGVPAPGMYPFAGPQPAFQPNFHGAPTPFVPFSPQLTPGQLSDLQRRMQPPRPMSPSDRLQSATFTNGLGRRLLAMVGLDQEPSATGNETISNGTGSTTDQTMRALQNATVLRQLSGGLQSIYGSLSKMYNSTVQQQLNLLQERFKKEAENSTNPWQQRMSQQVPIFFKNMAAKVGEAQENMNRIWQQMLAQAGGNGSNPTGAEQSAGSNQQGAFLSSFMSPNGDPGLFPAGNGNFFDQFGHSLGFGGQPQRAAGNDLGSQLMSFWHNQVQPQIGMVRNQMARVWRDLTASGSLTPEPMLIRSRNQFNGLGSAGPASGQADNSSSDLVDEILKEVDMSNSEYTIVDSKSDQSPHSSQRSAMSSQMQNRLIAMQRDLNQLWTGLTNSLQNAIGNVRTTLNPSAQQFGPTIAQMASSVNKQEADPEENEINGKVKDLGNLQREADTVHEVLRQQQQQQQRLGVGDRFRSFFNNVDLGNDFNQLTGRFGDSMARFGAAVGDLWNQIPRRWDNLMENMSPQSEMAKARLSAATSSTTTTTTTTTSEPPATEKQPQETTSPAPESSR